LCTSIPFFIAAQKTDYGNQSFLVYKTIEKLHYSPKSLSDDLSSFIYYEFINSLDPSHLFFLQEDIDEFKSFQYSIDDEIAAKTYQFGQLVTDRYKLRLSECDALTDQILIENLDFTVSDSLFINRYAVDEYPKNVSDREQLWRQLIRYKMLVECYGRLNQPRNSSCDLMNVNSLSKIKNTVKDKIKWKINRNLKTSKGIESIVHSEYLDAIAKSFDPHTAYFESEQAQLFKKSISTHSLSYGFFIITDENGSNRIAHLIPGGPAWKSNELSIGDEIVSINWGKDESLDISAGDSESINTMIELIPSKTIYLTVLKTDGRVRTVKLIKSVLKIESNTINGYVLQGEKNIGYIRLPDFYTSSWNEINAQGCANDVAKEIIKLQKDSIAGLIIDLRDNGGGSMLEAMNLLGIFIDEGPLSITHITGKKPVILKDMNRGAIYHGPLLVLVNKASASASELVAASLQDYNRAIIAGGTTYGKGTAQAIVPVDTSISRDQRITNNGNSFGYLKVTMQKIFRLNGQTYQKTGVVPDIILADITERFLDGESTYANAIQDDSIQKKVIFNKSNQILNSASFMELKSIFDKDSIFMFLEQTKPDISLLPDYIHLNIDRYLKQQRVFSQKSEKIRSIDQRQTTEFIVKNNSTHEEIAAMDEETRNKCFEEQKTIQMDIYVQSSFYILLKAINQ
jgi:carboxyl-terminal processing protease